MDTPMVNSDTIARSADEMEDHRNFLELNSSNSRGAIEEWLRMYFQLENLVGELPWWYNR